MTNTKKQLMTAIAMLVVAALALGTSTYAWFVANTSVKVETMTFTAEAVDNLSIALTTNDWDGSLSWTGATANEFKTLITASDVNELYRGEGCVLTGPALIPASTANGSNFFRIDTAAGDNAWGTSGGATVAKQFAAVQNINENSVKAIPLYLKSTSATAVYLGTNTTVSGVAATALRIAFVPDGGGSTIIWAPVPNTHVTDSAVTTQLVSNSGKPADGVQAAVSGTNSVGDLSNQIYKETKPSQIASLEPGVARGVMVYIWLEGCDVDCVPSISAKDLSISLEFTSSL